MGTEWEGDERVKARLRKTIRKRLERPWTATRTMEVLRRCPLTIAQQLVHWAIAVSTVVLDRVIKTMSIALLLTNNLDNPKQKKSNLLSPAPPPYLWSLLGKLEGPAPPPSSKISWSFDLAWNPDHVGIVDPVIYPPAPAPPPPPCLPPYPQRILNRELTVAFYPPPPPQLYI